MFANTKDDTCNNIKWKVNNTRNKKALTSYTQVAQSNDELIYLLQKQRIRKGVNNIIPI